MNRYLLSVAILLTAANTFFAQGSHSLTLNAALSPTTVLVGSSTGGVYTFPDGGGTLLTSGSISSVAWVLGGNSSPSSNIFGTLTADDVIMDAGGVEQMRLRSGGGINIPVTLNTGVGAIFQNSTVILHTFGTNNFFTGLNAGNFGTTGSDNTAVGNNALNANTSGSQNTAVGVGAMQNNTTGNINVGVGYHALFSNNGFNNTAVGINAMSANSTGAANTGVGSQALLANTSGSANAGFGTDALANNTTGQENTAVGFQALGSVTVNSQNTAVGHQALTLNTVSGNTAVGYHAMNATTIGGNNTAIGLNAGNVITTGANNTFIGATANATVGNLTNATAIGFGASVSANNSLILGNGANVGIGTSSPSQSLEVQNGNILISNNDNAARELRLREPSGSGTNYTAFKAQAQAADVTYTLPAADGSSGNTLSTNGTGLLSWAASIGGSGSGTINTIPKWTSASAIGNSLLTDNGTALNYNAGTFSVNAGSGTITTAGNLEFTSGTATIFNSVFTGINVDADLTFINGSDVILSAGSVIVNGGGSVNILDDATITGHTLITNTDNTAREIRLAEPSGSGANYTAFKAQAQAADVTYTLPAADGANLQALTTNGTGTLSWQNPAAGSLVLPFGQTASSATQLFALTNTDATTGGAGAFTINNAGNSGNALTASSNGTGTTFTALAFGSGNAIGGAANTGVGVYGSSQTNDAIQGQAITSGKAGVIGTTALANSGYGVIGVAIGSSTASDAIRGLNSSTTSGHAATFEVSNAANADNAVEVQTAGTGGAIAIVNTNNTAGEVRFNEPNGSGTDYTAFKAQAQAASVTYTLPVDGGSSGQVLSTSGGATATLSWANPVTPFSDFYALMPADNAATVAVGSAVDFPQDGPTSGAITRNSNSQFNLPNVGTYEVFFQVSVDEAGQLMLRMNGVELDYTVVGRATGTNQLTGMCMVTTSGINSTLEVVNPSGNSTALTITPLAGGTHPVSAHLVIKQIQ